MPHSSHQSDDRPFSRVLTDVGAQADPQLTLDELVGTFGERGFGALLLMLGLISAVIGVIPGTTTLLGIPILIIGVQLVFRRDELWLPGWILKRDLPREAFADAAAKVRERLERVERFSKPRLPFMSTDLSEALIGLMCVVWAAVLMLPLIGFNLFPSLIVAAFGFGLMQKDGVMMLVGWAGSAGMGIFTWLVWETVSRVLLAGWTWVTHLFG
ncbi:MAG: exopolysaccharide biosynthesis protein [Brevundimonas sp.]